MAACSGAENVQSNNQIETHPFLSELDNILEAGDIIFQDGTRGWGQYATFVSDVDKRYGHVGVVVRAGDHWGVIESSGDPMSDDAFVHQSTLEAFVAEHNHIGIYRLNLEDDEKQRFLQTIQRHVADKTVFDPGFSLDAGTGLYCTELVWLSLLEVTGEDPIPQKTRFLDKWVIAVDDLQLAEVLSPVAHLKR